MAKQLYKVHIKPVKGMPAYTGERYGMIFVQGNACTDSEYLAARLNGKHGYECGKVTVAEAKKLNLVIPNSGEETTEE